MKKLGCASCGGTKKMAKGGTTKSVSISKPGAGVVKETKGDTNQKMGIYGVAQTGPTGPNDSGIATMKKGGMVKKPLSKAQFGRTVVKSKFTREGLAGAKDSNDVKDVYNRKGDLVKTKINRTTTFDDGVKPLKSKITLKPGKPTVTKFPGVSRIKTEPTMKKGGATKSKKK